VALHSALHLRRKVVPQHRVADPHMTADQRRAPQLPIRRAGHHRASDLVHQNGDQYRRSVATRLSWRRELLAAASATYRRFEDALSDPDRSGWGGPALG
jgi:hypothetical protein